LHDADVVEDGGNGPLDKWFLVSGYLRNYLVLHSITLLIDDQYDGHSIKLV
jgi:hypothetical protein